MTPAAEGVELGSGVGAGLFFGSVVGKAVVGNGTAVEVEDLDEIECVCARGREKG